MARVVSFKCCSYNKPIGETILAQASADINSDSWLNSLYRVSCRQAETVASTRNQASCCDPSDVRHGQKQTPMWKQLLS